MEHKRSNDCTIEGDWNPKKKRNTFQLPYGISIVLFGENFVCIQFRTTFLSSLERVQRKCFRCITLHWINLFSCADFPFRLKVQGGPKSSLFIPFGIFRTFNEIKDDLNHQIKTRSFFEKAIIATDWYST